MAKKTKNLVLLVNEESGSFYVAWKDPRKNQAKMSFRKYDKKLRKHAIFKEKKLVYQ